MWAPPSQPPPGMGSPSPGPSSSNGRVGDNPYGPYPYAPTTEPTPGQPLLYQGQMLVYPSNWTGCSKCQNTGYKYGDPKNPCRKCWSKYGQTPNPILISSAGMRGAKVLQRPLHAGGGPGSAMAPMRTGGSGFAGSSWGPPPLHPSRTGSSGFAPPSHAPPPQHLPPRHPPPRPAVRRENNEEDLNEAGEAPPAYEDAVAAGPDGALPPQRRQDEAPSHNGGQSPSSMMAGMNVGPAPVSNTSVMLPTTPSGHIAHPAPYGGWRPPPQGGWGMPPQHHGLPFSVLPAGGMPPPNAIPVAPGDPRIGGRLCGKCGGSGVRETLWLSEETCNRCGGIGRLLM